MINPLYNFKDFISEKDINYWNTIYYDFIRPLDYKVVNLDIGKSLTYSRNFYALLSNEFKIDKRFWYPIALFNGFNSSLDYDGRKKIKIPNIEKLQELWERRDK